ITDYISEALEEARNRDVILYLKTVVAAYNRCIHVAEILWKEAEPSMDKINAENMMYHMFEPFMNEYLKTELATVKSQCDEQIEKWNQKLIEKTSERQQTILINSNREIYKRDYLTYFRKILVLPAPRSRSSTSSMSSQMSYNFDRRGKYKPNSDSTSNGLAPLVEFFELIHIADLIQQMVQVYYEEEMSRFIDKTDFFNACIKEKKTFEKILDESVAAGLNKGIQ
ncbi:8757_t:CDS:2, partial [Cetraspora pellucida]